jgi:hypothetical protein
MTFSITALSIVRLSIMVLFITLSIHDTHHNIPYYEVLLCLASHFIVMLSVIMLSVIMLSVTMLYVIVMNVAVPLHAALLSDNYKAKAIKIFLL